MVNPRAYDTKMDVWSVGCILGEMCNNYPLFSGSRGSMDHLNKVFNILGSPTQVRLDLSFSCALSTGYHSCIYVMHVCVLVACFIMLSTPSPHPLSHLCCLSISG